MGCLAVILVALLVPGTTLAQPRLDVAYDNLGGSLVLSWAVADTGYQLEVSDRLDPNSMAPPVGW